MNKNKEKVPKIRFPGFTEPWEQRKLGDVFAQKVNYVDPIKEMIELWSLTVEKGLTPKTERYNREALVKKNDKFKVVHPGDIVYNPMNMTIGAVGFNNSSKSVAVSGYYVTMNMKTGFDNKFFNTWLPSPNALNLYKNYATGSLIEKQRVQFPTLSGIKLDIPKLEEQIKIGSFFAKIDNLITLHQRKLNHLKDKKKGLLQKMFPKKGELVPELRFPEFTDPWEQRKFCDDIISIQTGTNKLGSEQNKGIPLLKMGNIQRGYFSLHKLEYLSDGEVEEPQNIAYYGDFFFNTRNTLELVGKGATWTGNSGIYAFNSNIAKFKFKNIDTIFFNYLYNTQNMIKQVHARAMGTTSVAAIYPHSLNSIEYSIPLIAEQEKIGYFLLQFDNLITLHQRKLDHLKEQKKALLQQMFI
ncbi:hypothetical protein HMPREF1084_01223 [Clostridium butyricum 60E.3]|uniref:restriction endonuclease subunit S n=1 Tax=Clostridium butyricum TaxID=1492 RepID=UPI0002D1E8A1|nr:restriction endonuclease subunit S [Clostridium butyricum]ENZ35214.1 hypothetical protein HMPREF1084_01223 [Clostridium butyricum 60E.3]